MIVYLDTSVILRVLLGQEPVWVGWARWKEAWTSELMSLEARRTLDRLRLESALDDQGVSRAHQNLGHIERGLGSIEVSTQVLRHAARPMPTIVKTLDAIHLATALLFREQREADLIFVTHDTQQETAARAFGFEVLAS